MVPVRALGASQQNQDLVCNGVQNLPVTEGLLYLVNHFPFTTKVRSPKDLHSLTLIEPFFVCGKRVH